MNHPPTHRRFWAPHALLPSGWAENVVLECNEAGHWAHLQPGVSEPPAGAERLCGLLWPGMPNLHSHAFQRAFAGLAEPGPSIHDTFWTWRDTLYRFAARMTPEALYKISRWVFVEMLEAGYTHVCEFHYLHHQANGQPYANPAEMSVALLRAADEVGIGLTLLPVLYQTSGFGGLAPSEPQRRFIHTLQSLEQLLQSLHPLCLRQGVRLGLAPHSLRAVPPEALAPAIEMLNHIDAQAPIHLHIAEQQQEVLECLAWTQQRPLEWLLDHVEVDSRWCLVHATHTEPAEMQRCAKTGAVVGLCPSTEANLGDGHFDFSTWQSAGGRWGLGSDSQVSLDPPDELQLLELERRLQAQHRQVTQLPSGLGLAEHLWLSAVAGGSQASGLPLGGLAVGQRADFVVLDTRHNDLAGLAPGQQLSSLLFARRPRSSSIEVWRQGKRRTVAGQHADHASALADFINARQSLLS